tara:strand:+ start:1114 stop:1668 length:555 start_codon:yes stop_codon:yes gene_type:complete
MASFMKSDTSFMKPDISVVPGQNLLTIKKPLPIEIKGAGQLCRPYDTWALAVCADEHVPRRKTPGAAGHDLHSISDVIVPAGSSAMVNTGLSIQLPNGHYGKIEGRSSLGIKHSVIPFGGVIDQDYRGVIMVKLFNLGSTDYFVRENDRIAQLIVQRFSAPTFKLVKTLESSARGTHGFGSTGK